MTRRNIRPAVLALLLATSCSTPVSVRVSRDAQGQVRFQLVEFRSGTPVVDVDVSISSFETSNPATNRGYLAPERTRSPWYRALRRSATRDE